MAKLFAKLLGRKQTESDTVKLSAQTATEDIKDSEADKVSGGPGYGSWW